MHERKKNKKEKNVYPTFGTNKKKEKEPGGAVVQAVKI